MGYAIGELQFISGLPVSLPLHKGWVPATDLTYVVGRPGELDAAMARGELAAAPISSLEYTRRKDRYTLLPDLGISSWGRIGSSILFSRVPFSQLSGQTVALPRFGATSNVMVQFFLAKMFGVDASYEEQDGSIDELLARYPAALLIGDQAILEGRKVSDKPSLDLGEAWWMMMKSPMVHTVWACQANLPDEDKLQLGAMFQQAKAAGKAHHAEVVGEAANRLGIPEAEIEAYFALLNYDWSPVHDTSLALLGDYVQEYAQAR